MDETQNVGARRRVFSKPRALADALVSTEPLFTERLLPLLITPALDGVDLCRWADTHRPDIERLLTKHGGILFRGFGVSDPTTLAQFVRAVSTGPLEYRERSSPRTHLSEQIYTSTEHPPDQEIFLHNEQSYNQTFPTKIIFACAIEPRDGGATPIADVRDVYRRIDPAIRARFERHGYTYVRNFGTGLGLSWQNAFQTTDPGAVDAYCHDHAITAEWRDGGRLRTRQVRRVSGRHPISGASVWFNHATFFHYTTLDESLRTAFALNFGSEDEYPNTTLYGDGSPIEPTVMESLRQAYRDCSVAFPWRAGDVLLLDNMLTAHARQRFSGPRKILTGLADPWPWNGILRADQAP